MKTTKKIKVPYINGLEKMDLNGLEYAMEVGGAKFYVNENNWAKQFPYAPDCCGAIARCDDYLCVIYHVRGLDLRATELEDCGRSWEDSCCEFFVNDPYDGSYYNFEITCIGSLLNAKHINRSTEEKRTKEELSRVIRMSSLPFMTGNIADKICRWSVAMLIPFDLIGIKGNLPVSLRGNFYKCGDLTAHPHFLSWNPIDTPKPDFHRPEFFGELILQ